MRFAASLEYDGTDFYGWQSQSHARNVQDCVEKALSTVAACRVATVCAGRTDAGVHACGQVIHFDSGSARTPREWLFGANAHLPADVCLRWVRRTAGDFHARTDALRRHYRYVILNDATRSALLRTRSTRVHQPLDARLMHDAAQALAGEHDFSAYRSAGCRSKTPVRRVEFVRVHRGGRFVYIDICANAFLQHMVRNIAGVLIAIGRGERPAGWAAQVLAGRDRRAGGVTSPGTGLYLVAVEYGKRHSFPAAVAAPQF